MADTTSQNGRICVTGHLRVQNGIYQMIVSFKNSEGKWKYKQRTSGLPEKGNLRRAEKLLLNYRLEVENELNTIVQGEECKSADSDNKGNEQLSTEGSVLFVDYLAKWLRKMKYQVAETTYASYKYAMEARIIPYFEPLNLMLDEVTSDHIEDYYEHELEVNKVTTNTVIHRHANLHKAFSDAAEKGLILVSPMTTVARPEINDFVSTVYSLGELDELFSLVKEHRLEFAVIMAAFYGLRRSEIIGLKWSAFDFERMSITIRHVVTQCKVDGKYKTIEKDRTKNKKMRTLPLVPQVAKLLLAMKEQQEYFKNLCGNCYDYSFAQYVYVNELGIRMKPDYITYHFPRILKKGNMVRIRFHDLRHSCATLLHKNGVPLADISAWLGHSSVITTANIYMHLDFDDKTRSANALMGLFDNTEPIKRLTPCKHSISLKGKRKCTISRDVSRDVANNDKNVRKHPK